MLAEGDRDVYRRQHAALEREKEIMKDVKGWEVRFLYFLLLICLFSSPFASCFLQQVCFQKFHYLGFAAPCRSAFPSNWSMSSRLTITLFLIRWLEYWDDVTDYDRLTFYGIRTYRIIGRIRGFI